MADETDTKPDTGNQGGGWDSILKQLDGEKNKAKRDKAKAEAKKLLEERAELEKGLRLNDRKLAELREKFENDEL